MNDKQLATTKTMMVNKETLEDFLFSQCKNDISDEQKSLFIGIALANNLNPFKREIYPIPFWNNKLGKNDMQPVTAYTVYLQKAQASGKLDGWKAEVYEDDKKKVTGGKITIHRTDWSKPFEWEVTRDEIVQCKKDGTPNKNWQDKPKFMTKKTLIGQGMRLCFPEDIGGMPYLEEEIWNAQVIDVEDGKKKVSLSQIEKMKALKDLLEEKSDDWIVENLLPRHIKGGTRTIIRRSDINGKHLRTKVKYVGYCGPMLIRNFCIDYKKNGGQFDEAVEAGLLYRSV